MTRRGMMAAMLLPVMATACAPQPPDFSYAGTGDPLYVALSTAQRNSPRSPRSRSASTSSSWPS